MFLSLNTNIVYHEDMPALNCKLGEKITSDGWGQRAALWSTQISDNDIIGDNDNIQNANFVP